MSMERRSFIRTATAGALAGSIGAMAAPSLAQSQPNINRTYAKSCWFLKIM